MQILWAAIFPFCLFFAVLACLRLGWILGQRHLRLAGEDANAGLGAIDAAVFGLMGLLLAFTFTGAASRFDHRRDLITEEVNAIGTAYLRLDLFQEGPRDELRALFREYLDGRLAVYRDPSNREVTVQARAKMAEVQKRLWDRMQQALRDSGQPALGVLVLPPANQMLDIAETRYRATLQHPPAAIYMMLGLLVLVSALLAGFEMGKAKRQSLLHMIGFAATTAVSVYLILDLEHPRLGLVRVDTFDQALLDLRASME